MTIYFYKVDEPYGCFSNFSLHSICINGQNWLTVEHYYQAQKFVTSDDQSLVAMIQAVSTPQEAANLGRDPKYRVRADWEAVKISVMCEAVKTKFITHPDIQLVLLNTADRLIVENSPTDYYWGCGGDRTGQNYLGQILMSVRREISESLANSEKL
jgi:N-glycosidase YbiA